MAVIENSYTKPVAHGRLGSNTKKFAQNGYCGIPYRRCALSILDFSPLTTGEVSKSIAVWELTVVRAATCAAVSGKSAGRSKMNTQIKRIP
jgi:hypothetical protein